MALLLEVPEDGRLETFVIPLVGLLLFIAAFGLWRLKGWAWWLTMALQFAAATAALTALISGAGAAGALVVMAGSLFALYWLYGRRSLFAGEQGAVVASGGNWWLLAVMVLVPFAALVASAILGLLGAELWQFAGQLFGRGSP